MKRVVFIDRDGTIIQEPADFQIDSLEKLEWIPGIVTGLRTLVDSGFTLVMVSNQDGLGSKKYPKRSFEKVQAKILRLLSGEGIEFEKVFICPHFEKDGCGCRKPKSGLLKGYLKSGSIDLSNSFVFGDRETDVELARNIGVRSVRLTSQKKTRADYATADAADACRWILQSVRSAKLERKTKETRITASLSLDGSGRYDVHTGIPFFDHMLEQLAKHSRMDLKLHAQGDTEIDAHHTVEDVGIVLGQALRQALGEKRGIERYAFVLPMDEARTDVALDLSGRAFLKFEADFKRPEIGGLPTELVHDFFLALTDGLQATLHIASKGRNDHHKIESIFKGVARAFKLAFQVDGRSRGLIPSTKGML